MRKNGTQLVEGEGGDNIFARIYKGDAVEVLRRLDDGIVDIIVTDPPYNVSKEGFRFKRKNADISFDFGEWDRKDEMEYYNWTEEWFKEAVRVLKNKGWIYIFMSKERIGYFNSPIFGLFSKYGIKTRNVLVWCKPNPVPSFRKMNYLSATEFIVVGSKGDSRIPNFLHQKDMRNYFIYPNASSYKKTKHPNEKPVELIKWILRTGSKSGGTVLDPFMGSGSTMEAAIDLGRNFIGIEINEAYIEMAKKRVSWGSGFGIDYQEGE